MKLKNEHLIELFIEKKSILLISKMFIELKQKFAFVLQIL